MSIQTGYFGRPSMEPCGNARTTKTHLWDDVKNRCLCGYRPHKTMLFQFCAGGVYLNGLECDRCKEAWEAPRLKESIESLRLESGMVFHDRHGRFLTIMGLGGGVDFATASLSRNGGHGIKSMPKDEFKAMLLEERFRPLFERR